MIEHNRSLPARKTVTPILRSVCRKFVFDTSISVWIRGRKISALLNEPRPEVRAVHAACVQMDRCVTRLPGLSSSPRCRLCNVVPDRDDHMAATGAFIPAVVTGAQERARESSLSRVRRFAVLIYRAFLLLPRRRVAKDNSSAPRRTSNAHSARAYIPFSARLSQSRALRAVCAQIRIIT